MGVEQSDPQETSIEMWIFFTLTGLGLTFMLYAHDQFHGEIKNTGPSTPAQFGW